MSYFVLPIMLFTFSNVSFSRLITSVGEERAVFSAIDYFMFLWVLEKGCIISFWRSLGLSIHSHPIFHKRKSKNQGSHSRP